MLNVRTIAGLLVVTSVAGMASVAQAADPTTMRSVGNFSGNRKQVEGVERPFFDGISKATGLPLSVTFSPMDAIGVQGADALRHLRSGTFDVMSVQINLASRDDPFFDGVDLIGVSTNVVDLRKVVAAYREVFDKRLQERFGSKVLTLWPFGPQVLYCNVPIKTLDDLKGLKVRTSSASMAQFVQKLGSTPVTLPFSEVYPALQRGVTNCAITSPSAGNSAKWPEITNHYLPLSLSSGVNGHFVSLAYWNRFSPESQQKLTAAFKKMEDDMWDLAIKANDDASNCNIGKDPCVEGTKFGMTLVTVSPDDSAKVRDAVSTVILPAWRDLCTKIDPSCTKTWNETVGAVTGYSIK